MNKSCNTRGRPATAADVAHELGIGPLNARSVVLSALLGSHPPELPVAALVDLASLFSITPGTLRTALSRLAARGEVAAATGRYRLAGRLVARQREQDEGRTTPADDWDGAWWTATAHGGPRLIAERRRLRSAMTGARMGELRAGTWMRPANIAVTLDLDDVVIVRGDIRHGEPAQIATRLWDLPVIEQRAEQLHVALGTWHEALAGGVDAVIAPAFTAFAACLQFLRAEPQLPVELTPSPHARALRADYAAFEPALQQRLAAVYRAALSRAGR